MLIGDPARLASGKDPQKGQLPTPLCDGLGRVRRVRHTYHRGQRPTASRYPCHPTPLNTHRPPSRSGDLAPLPPAA